MSQDLKLMTHINEKSTNAEYINQGVSAFAWLFNFEKYLYFHLTLLEEIHR